MQQLNAFLFVKYVTVSYTVIHCHPGKVVYSHFMITIQHSISDQAILDSDKGKDAIQEMLTSAGFQYHDTGTPKGMFTMAYDCVKQLTHYRQILGKDDG